MTERMEELPERVGGVEQKIDALSVSVDARFDAVDARFDAVDARFDAVDARSDALVASMNAEFEHVAAAFVEQRQYTEFAFDRLGQEMRTGFNRLDDRLGRVERKLDQFIDTQSATNALVERRLQRLEPPT